MCILDVYEMVGFGVSVTYDVVTRLVVVRRLRLSSHRGAASVTEPSLARLVLS